MAKTTTARDKLLPWEAALLAAAPELLDELRNCASDLAELRIALHGAGITGHDAKIQAAIDAARAAIAKAVGP